MRGMWVPVAVFLALVSVEGTAKEQGVKQPGAPAEPPASGSTSSQLSRSGGVITPPANVDPGMKKNPPPSGDTMPVVPPTGAPGGDPSVKPQ
jgi:hypothetical protein